MARRRISVIISTVVLALAGCGGGRTEHQVFTELPHDGGHSTFPASLSQIVDFAVPDFNNITNSPVRITGVSVVDPPSAMHLVNLRSYRYSDTGGIGILIERGDLPKACSDYSKPHPVNDIVVRPHQPASSFAVLAVVFEHYGQFEISQLRIDYVTNGKPGYQIQNFNTLIKVQHRHFAGVVCPEK